MKRLLTTAALLAACAFTPAHAGHGYPGEGFVRPPTQIKGCIAIVDKVRDGSITPTEWMEQNKEGFADLQLELKERNYPPAKAKDMMMGMAITICMENKGLANTCVTARDPEKRDVQIMRTAHIPECWAKQSADNGNGNGGGDNSTTTPTIEIPRWPDPPRPPQIALSPQDQAQLNEDLAIVKQPVVIIGDHENGAKEARLAHCGGYWNERMHYNRSQEARNLLWAVRVWRCMFRTGYTVFTQRCPGVSMVASIGWGPALQELQRPHCYARFG